MHRWQILILLLIAAMLFSCKAGFVQPTIQRLHDVRLLDLTPDQTRLSVSLEVNNPNKYDLSVLSMQVVLLDKNRIPLGNINLPKPLLLEGKTSRNVDFEIILDTRKVAKLISHNSQNVFFYIKATAIAKARNITKTVEYETPYELNFLPILEKYLPQFTTGEQELFKVLKTTVTEIGISETQITIRFLLLNPFGLTFTLVDFPAELYINDKLAGKGNLVSPVKFDETVFSSEGELVFKLSNWNSLKGAIKSLLKKELNYQVKGNVNLVGFGMRINKPYSFKSSIDINLLGLFDGK